MNNRLPEPSRRPDAVARSRGERPRDPAVLPHEIEDLEHAYIDAMLTLSQAADARTEYRPGRAERSGQLAERIARALSLPEDRIADIRCAATLHDIGQMRVPEYVLRTPCPLTREEWQLVRLHPAAGAQMLTPAARLGEVAEIVHAHHERWDGRGYPRGLRGDEIPVGARIVAVVAAYLAMTEARPYQFARSHREAVAEMRRCAGTQFDPTVVEAFATAKGDAGDRPDGDVPGPESAAWAPIRAGLARLLESSRQAQEELTGAG